MPSVQLYHLHPNYHIFSIGGVSPFRNAISCNIAMHESNHTLLRIWDIFLSHAVRTNVMPNTGKSTTKRNVQSASYIKPNIGFPSGIEKNVNSDFYQNEITPLASRQFFSELRYPKNFRRRKAVDGFLRIRAKVIFGFVNLK